MTFLKAQNIDLRLQLFFCFIVRVNRKEISAYNASYVWWFDFDVLEVFHLFFFFLNIFSECIRDIRNILKGYYLCWPAVKLK